MESNQASGSSFRCFDSGFYCVSIVADRQTDSPPPPPCLLRWIWGWICLRGSAPRRSAAWSDTSPSPRTPRTLPRPPSPPLSGKHWDKESTPSPSDRNQISRVSVQSGCCWLTVWTLPPHTGPPWTTEPHGTLGHGVLPLSMHRIELDRYWFYWLVYQ